MPHTERASPVTSNNLDLIEAAPASAPKPIDYFQQLAQLHRLFIHEGFKTLFHTENLPSPIPVERLSVFINSLESAETLKRFANYTIGLSEKLAIELPIIGVFKEENKQKSDYIQLFKSIKESVSGNLTAWKADDSSCTKPSSALEKQSLLLSDDEIVAANSFLSAKVPVLIPIRDGINDICSLRTNESIVTLVRSQLREGRKFLKQENYESAITEFLKGIRLFKSNKLEIDKLLKELFKGLVKSQLGLGNKYHNDEQFEEAIAPYENALEAFKLGKIIDKPLINKIYKGLVDSLICVSGECYFFKQYEETITTLEKASIIAQSTQAIDNHQTKVIKAYLAMSRGMKCFHNLEDEAAIVLLEKAVVIFTSMEINETEYNNTPIFIVDCLKKLGILYGCNQEFEKALEAFERILVVIKPEKLFDKTLEQEIEGYIAYCSGGRYYMNGEFKEAVELFEIALTIFKALKEIEEPRGIRTNLAHSQKNLGIQYYRDGAIETAIGAFVSALVTVQPIKASLETLVKEIGGYLAYCFGLKCREKGENEKAIGFFREALVVANSVKVTDKNLANWSCGCIAECYKDIGIKGYHDDAIEVAIAAFESAAVVVQPIKEMEEILVKEIHGYLAFCLGIKCYTEEKYEEAIELLSRALAIFNSIKEFDGVLKNNVRSYLAFSQKRLGIQYYGDGPIEAAIAVFESAAETAQPIKVMEEILVKEIGGYLALCYGIKCYKDDDSNEGIEKAIALLEQSLTVFAPIKTTVNDVPPIDDIYSLLAAYQLELALGYKEEQFEDARVKLKKALMHVNSMEVIDETQKNEIDEYLTYYLAIKCFKGRDFGKARELFESLAARVTGIALRKEVLRYLADTLNHLGFHFYGKGTKVRDLEKASILFQNAFKAVFSLYELEKTAVSLQNTFKIDALIMDIRFLIDNILMNLAHCQRTLGIQYYKGLKFAESIVGCENALDIINSMTVINADLKNEILMSKAYSLVELGRVDCQKKKYGESATAYKNAAEIIKSIKGLDGTGLKKLSAYLKENQTILNNEFGELSKQRKAALKTSSVSVPTLFSSSIRTKQSSKVVISAKKGKKSEIDIHKAIANHPKKPGSKLPLGGKVRQVSLFQELTNSGKNSSVNDESSDPSKIAVKAS